MIRLFREEYMNRFLKYKDKRIGMGNQNLDTLSITGYFNGILKI